VTAVSFLRCQRPVVSKTLNAHNLTRRCPRTQEIVRKLLSYRRRIFRKLDGTRTTTNNDGHQGPPKEFHRNPLARIERV
jgi:hypothetical protein